MMGQYPHSSNDRTASASLVGIAGYLAIMIAGLALLSAPVLAGATLAALGVGVAGGRWLASRQRPPMARSEDSAAVQRDPVAD